MTSHGVTYRTVWGRPQDVTLGRPHGVIFKRPKDVSRGRPQDVRRGHPLELHRGPYGDVHRTSFRDVSRTSLGRKFAEWVISLKLLFRIQRNVLACLALHNYLRQTSNALDTPAGFIDSESSDGAPIPNNSRAARYADECMKPRDDLKDYFHSENKTLP